MNFSPDIVGLNVVVAHIWFSISRPSFVSVLELHIKKKNLDSVKFRFSIYGVKRLSFLKIQAFGILV